MTPSKIYKHQPLLELRKDIVGNFDARDTCLRKSLDLDEVDPAVRGAKLILYPALVAEQFHLDMARGIRNLPDRHPARAEAVERSDEGYAHCSRCAGRRS